MSNVIRFLETMGADAAMSRMSILEYQAAVAALDIDEQSRESLLMQDGTRLADALDGRHKMFCMIFAPEEREAPDGSESEEEAPASPDDAPPEK